MSIETSISIKTSGKKAVTDLLESFNQIGWTLVDEQGKLTYLPLGDDDRFDWRNDHIGKDKLLNMISEKEKRGETIGVILYQKGTGIGVTLLAFNAKEILLSFNINRKNKPKDITEREWLQKYIINELKNVGYPIATYTFEEY